MIVVATSAAFVCSFLKHQGPRGKCNRESNLKLWNDSTQLPLINCTTDWSCSQSQIIPTILEQFIRCKHLKLRTAYSVLLVLESKLKLQLVFSTINIWSKIHKKRKHALSIVTTFQNRGTKTNLGLLFCFFRTKFWKKNIE